MADPKTVSGFMAAALDREDIVGGSGSIMGSGSGSQVGSSQVGKTPTAARRERAEGSAGGHHVGVGGSRSGLGGSGSALGVGGSGSAGMGVNSDRYAERYAQAKMTRTKTMVVEKDRKGPWSESDAERSHRHGAARAEGKLFVLALGAFFCVWTVLIGVWFDYTHLSEELHLYPYFRDVLVMVLVGFGFLMSFLRRYGFSAVTYTLLVASCCVPWSLLLGAFFKRVDPDVRGAGVEFADTFEVTFEDLLESLFCSAAVLITLGALLGKTTPLQLFVIVLIEPIFFWLNAYTIFFKLETHDIGGGYSIHLFGAVFGLAMSFFLTWRFGVRGHADNTSCYSSDLTALIGTLFLWIYWPSFNAAIATGEGQIRAIMNTVLSLCGATVATILSSRLLGGNRFDIVHIQNSILSGGVAMGIAADLDITLGGALGAGFVAGCVSAAGYVFLTPLLSHRFHLQDVCGVTNLHGVPALIASLVSIIATATLDSDQFPRGSSQPLIQLAATGITIGIAALAGFLTSVIVRFALRPFNHIPQWSMFNDRVFYHLPSDYDAVVDSGLTNEDLL